MLESKLPSKRFLYEYIYEHLKYKTKPKYLVLARFSILSFWYPSRDWRATEVRTLFAFDVSLLNPNIVSNRFLFEQLVTQKHKSKKASTMKCKQIWGEHVVVQWLGPLRERIKISRLLCRNVRRKLCQLFRSCRSQGVTMVVLGVT